MWTRLYTVDVKIAGGDALNDRNWPVRGLCPGLPGQL